MKKKMKEYDELKAEIDNQNYSILKNNETKNTQKI